ncbi:MAG: anti-sigma factor [Acidimicrobiia bacterium]
MTVVPARRCPHPRRLVLWRRMLVPVAAALAVVMVVVLGFVVAQLNERATLVEMTADQTRQILTATDVVLVSLHAPTGVSATFAFSPQLGLGVFSAEGLDPVDPSEVYELWTISSDGASPAGTFRPDPQGGTSQLVSGDLREVEALGVTIEPAGGSEQPTGEILISGEL